MNNTISKQFRILAVSPSTKGVGFVILEGQDTLVDWGVKSIKGDKNIESVAKVKELLTQYHPGVLVLENTSIKDSRRSPRIKTLSKKIIALARTHKVSVTLFSQTQVRESFFTDGQGTKHNIAAIIAQKFPEELASRLPPQRKLWMSEDRNMSLFYALALALVFRLKKKIASRKEKQDG